MSNPLWTPSPERIARANVTAFLQHVAGTWQADATDMPSLYRWSIAHPERFWESVWRFCEVRAERPYDRVVDDFDRMPGATWFPGARLNWAANLLGRRPEGPALIAHDETGRRREVSWPELTRQVGSFSRWLRSVGVGVGDRVAGFLPNGPEGIVAHLGAAAVGATWSSTSPDFGRQGTLDRFGQVEPQVLLAADGWTYRGKRHDGRARLAEFLPDLPSVRHVVVVSGGDGPADTEGVRDAVRFDETVSDGGGGPECVSLPFDHPLCILFSSGTTGVPKCIVHGAGGTLLQHLKEHVLHTDVKPGDRVFYHTTLGWMMWNWLVGGLAAGATLVLYDGSPVHPGPARLFDLAERERFDVLGASAAWIGACRKAGLEPARTHDLSALRTILSTGSVLPPESFDWVYSHAKRDVCLSSISGGTDIVSCFALGNPIGPVRRGELQTRGLGMNVQVFDDDGWSRIQGPGELVCTAPFPSMPTGFLNDPDGARYRETYFARFPGTWRHGDWVELTGHDGMIFHGRSDAVLNPGGVRIGTAEVTRGAERVEEVVESLAVGQQFAGEERVVLFVRLREGVVLNADLEQRIRAAIRDGATARHVPAMILQVPDLPRTKSGKLVELAVRDVIHGRPVKNLEALANPETLEHFRDRPELKIEEGRGTRG